MRLDSQSRGEALKCGAVVVLFVAALTAYTVHLSNTWTGADAAALARGGCPEGYIAVTTTHIGLVGSQSAVAFGTQCVVNNGR